MQSRGGPLRPRGVARGRNGPSGAIAGEPGTGRRRVPVEIRGAQEASGRARRRGGSAGLLPVRGRIGIRAVRRPPRQGAGRTSREGRPHRDEGQGEERAVPRPQEPYAAEPQTLRSLGVHAAAAAARGRRGGLHHQVVWLVPQDPGSPGPQACGLREQGHRGRPRRGARAAAQDREHGHPGAGDRLGPASQDLAWNPRRGAEEPVRVGSARWPGTKGCRAQVPAQ
jgi:hypothetical protein